MSRVSARAIVGVLVSVRFMAGAGLRLGLVLVSKSLGSSSMSFEISPSNERWQGGWLWLQSRRETLCRSCAHAGPGLGEPGQPGETDLGASLGAGVRDPALPTTLTPKKSPLWTHSSCLPSLGRSLLRKCSTSCYQTCHWDPSTPACSPGTRQR